ncbi:MAG: sigma-54-dependent Fis family transcriptional regulator [Deltaproteobacteria bacterium]|jgi:transcriptional regulator with PAS, ATPase and Fis domain|nr:sigma-54-dependent Fis family transcriptional regulator [Deltaproteobacteria bacterium]
METPLIGKSESIERIRELIKYIADTDLNVLITGESGVGKEVVAQHLYYKSKRKGKPFIKVNCAALPEGLLESELFGFERGAFTGADRKRRGKFELAHKGIIFLDEIGDMSLPLQSKLLHVLQSGEFAPLGSEREVRSDLWVITATNQELEKKVKEGFFRQDLYYRLNTIRIDIPPLRKRPEDITPLIDYYIEEYSSELDGSRISKPDAKVIEKLKAYSWPGNVRELQNILSRFKVFGNWEEIVNDINLASRFVEISKLEEQFFTNSSFVNALLDFKNEDLLDNKSFSLKTVTKKATDMVEKEVITSVLDITDWNRKKASKILDVSYRTILYKINDLNIKRQPNQKSLKCARLLMSY